MIIWDKLKLMNQDVSLEVSPTRPTGSSVWCWNFGSCGLVAQTAWLTNTIVSGNATFTGSVSMPAGMTFNGTGTLTLPSNLSFSGPITIPSGSQFASSISSATITTASIGTCTINQSTIGALSVTEQLTVKGQPRIDLAEGSTYNGQRILTFPSQYGYWLDAYQGPGNNWIEIRNNTNVTLNIASLQFSGHTWQSNPSTAGVDQIDPIQPHAKWRAEAFWDWGRQDTPGNITMTYASSTSEDVTKTWTPSEWNASGGVVFGESTEYPGQILIKTDKVLTVMYTSDNADDVQSWYAYAMTSGYTRSDKFTYSGVSYSTAVSSGGRLTNSTRLAGSYILTFYK